MRPEDWLRERGIEVARGREQPRRGDVAGQATAAMPVVPRDQTPIEQIETLRMPALPKADAAPHPRDEVADDIADRPTGTLSEDVQNLPTAALTAEDTAPTTALLPAPPQDISATPTRRLPT